MLHKLSLTVWFPHVDQGDVLMMQKDNQQKLSNELVTCHSVRIHVYSTRLGNTPGQLLWDDKTRPRSRWMGKGCDFTFNGHQDIKSACMELPVNLIINVVSGLNITNLRVYVLLNCVHFYTRQCTAVSWKSNDCLTWPSIPNIFFMWTLLMWTKSTSSFAAVIINTATGVAAQEETKKWFLNNLKQGTLTSVLSKSRQSHRNMFSVAVFYLASQANTARDSPSENAHFVLLSLPTLTLRFLPLQCWEQPLSTHNRTP